MELPHIDEATWQRLRTRVWRQPTRQRKLFGAAVLLVLLLHIVFVLVIRYEMRPRPTLAEQPSASRDDAIQVQLIEQPAAAPPPALPPPPAMPTTAPAKLATRLPPPRPHPPQRPAQNALSVVEHASTATVPAAASSVPAAPQLYRPDGSAVPAAPTVSAAPAAGTNYTQRMPQGDTQIMQHSSPINYQPTRFDAGYGKTGAVTQALQKAVDKTTVAHTFHPLPGVRIHCALSFAALAGGCGGDPPPPPSAKDGDERLNMAPASLLAKNPHAVKPPSVDECVADYRAGMPLPQGCPVDTPSRTTSAEFRACVDKYRAQKILGAACPNQAVIKEAQAEDAAGATH